MRDNYIRNENLPKAGFAAGPCLPKDTLQLSSQYSHKYELFKIVIKSMKVFLVS